MILWSESEKSVLEDIRLQSEDVVSCLSIMEEIFVSMLSGRKKDIQKKVEEFALLRSKVDEARRKILIKLSNWSSNLVDREDLVHLTGKIDAVAGSAGFAISNLTILRGDVVRRVLGKEEFSTMIKDALKCARMLNDAVAGFVNGKDVASMIDNVDRVEHVVDEKHLVLRRKLQDDEFADVPMTLAIGVSRVIDGIEGVADRSEEAAEILRTILTKLR
ncbi:MAG: DUF47 family protein [Candidatus Jordarchaeales archaeon]|nr:DUF47 family protein [Candidatus Jordarchaeia archaeon]